MKFKRVLFLAIVYSFILTTNIIDAQTGEKTTSFKVTADLVSTYVWRGSLATGSPTPNFQSALAYINGNFEIGVWGSTDFIGSYKELDPYISFTAGKIKLGFTDYNWSFFRADYFNYKNSETGHRLEGTIGFIGTETIPVTVTWNSMFYGFDKDPADSTRQAYSTYIELGFTKGVASFFLDLLHGQAIIIIMGPQVLIPVLLKKHFLLSILVPVLQKHLKSQKLFLYHLRLL